LSNLNYSTASPIYNFLKDKNTLLKEYRNKSGIYLIHNNINGKKYIPPPSKLAGGEVVEWI
jgi:hypothetical protein